MTPCELSDFPGTGLVRATVTDRWQQQESRRYRAVVGGISFVFDDGLGQPTDGTLDSVERFRDVDAYLARAELWPDEILALRLVLRATGLEEEVKWGKPCYTDRGKNVVIVQEFKGFLALMFFKGALLDDPDGLLEDQGENTRSAKRLVFRSVDDVERLTPAIADFVRRAIEVEEAGLELPAAPELELVEELAERLKADPGLRAAFESLTPGRRREYNLHISAAKQPKTRQSRVERLSPRILQGKGLREN